MLRFFACFARAIGLWLPIEKLGVDAVLLNQVIDTVLTFAAALVALDAQHVELAGDVADCESRLARLRVSASLKFGACAMPALWPITT